MLRSNSWCLRRRCGFPLLSTCHASDNSSSSASLSCRSVNGLHRNPFAPFSMASTAVALSASAETTRISTLELIATNCCTHSTPSISGMVRSMVTTSGCVRRNSSTASRPLLAAPTTSRRAICCERSMRRRMMFESSTIMSFNEGLASSSMASRRLRIIRLLGGARQRHGQPGELAGAGRDRNPSAHLIDEVRYQIHAHPPSGILGRRLDGGEAGLEQQREDLLRVHGLRLLGSNESFFQCGFLDALGR